MSAGPGPYPSFQTNVNRQKTKRWVEAKSFSYDGDEWGDDDGYDEPEPHPPPQSTDNAPAARAYPSYGGPGPMRPVDGPPPNRNMGNPNIHHRGRPSFDDRRPGPPQQGSFEGPYPTAQRPPFTGPEHYRKSPSQDRGMRPRGGSQPRPMGFDPHPHAPFMPDTRSGGPYPMRPNERRSESGHRPNPGEIYGRQSPARQSPVPSSSRNSRDSSPSHRFPPRKSSLSQQQAPFKPSGPGETSTSVEASIPTPPDDHNEEAAPKPLPFVRPADIYKRMEEEREKQRRASQESSRPSIDSERFRSSSPPPSHSHTPSIDQSDSTERIPRSKPTLDPVTERKSEYGLDKMLEDAPEDPPSTTDPQSAVEPTSSIIRSQTYASSQYSDRPDPISASSAQSKQSFAPSRQDIVQVPGTTGSIEEDQPTPRQSFGFPQPNSHSEPSKMGPGLKHNQSLGYRSLVNKAFDDSEDQVPPTPMSMGDSVPRSNSASTSQISPIISRNSSAAAQASSSGGLTDAPPTIPEEPSSRPTSSGTAKDHGTEEEPLTPPPIVQSGYRRDTNTPSPKNSPAKRPVSVEINNVPRSELATLATTTPVQLEPSGEQKPAPTSIRQGTGQPTGSPIPRSESPTKGKVRDLAGKFNTPSQSSPSSSSPKESPRPLTARNESFRPVLPGGWLSYTTNTGQSTPAPETPGAPKELYPHPEISASRNQLSESPLIAIAPKQRSHDQPTAPAFAAAAAAGSALANAFSTAVGQPSKMEQTRPKEDVRFSPHERNRSTGSSDGDLQQPTRIETAAVSAVSSKPPTPPPKGFSESYSASTAADYFPMPLSPRKSTEDGTTPMRPQMLPSLSTDTSPQDMESDRLRKEILKDLTPRSAKFDPSTDIRSESTLTPKLRDQVESTLIPEEYNTYWNDISQTPNLNLSNPAADTPEMSSESKDLPSLPQAQSQAVPSRTVKKRFSWESWSDEEQSVRAAQPIPPQIEREAQNQVLPAPTEATKPDTHIPESLPISLHLAQDATANRAPKSESPIFPPHIPNERADHLVSPPTSPSPLPGSSDVRENEPVSRVGSPESQSPQPISKQSSDQPRISLDSSPQKVPAFREIMLLKTPQERILAYNSARQQFMQMDTGLTSWLQITSNMLPEHADIVNKNGRASNQQTSYMGHKPSPSRSKFPRIASLGGTVQPSQESHPQGHPQREVSDSYGSKLSSHQMQEEGKKLLHSAGKFSGKAGGAAKGLLMKGKNRLRQSGGEKARSKSAQYENARAPPHSSDDATLIAPATINDNTREATALPDQIHAPINENVEQIQEGETQQNEFGHRTPQQEPPRLEVSQSNTPPREALNQEVLRGEEARLQRTDGLNEPTRPLDEVSAISSHDEANIPSRSISEVTGPRDSRDDTRLLESAGNKEPTADMPEQDTQNVPQPGELKGGKPFREQAPGSMSPPNMLGGSTTVNSLKASKHETPLREQRFDPESTLRGPEAWKREGTDLTEVSTSRVKQPDPTNLAIQHDRTNSLENLSHHIRQGEPYNREEVSISPPIAQQEHQEALPDRRQRQSYSRPFKEADAAPHPAFRNSPEDIERRSQVYAFEEATESGRPEESYQSSIRQQGQILQSPLGDQEDSIYRIPGPYGQQYRSPRQPARPPQQFSPTHDYGYDITADVRRSMRFDEYGNPISYNSSGRTRPPSQERPFIPRPNATEYALPGVGPPPPPPKESPPKSRPRSGIFGRARSRSRPPVRNEDAEDTIEDMFSEDKKKKERRSSLFGRRTSKQSVSARNQFDEVPPQNVQHSSTLPPNFSFQDDVKKAKKLQRASTSETTKKTGFARLSGIFSRSKSTSQPSPSVPLQSDQMRRDAHGPNAIQSPTIPSRHGHSITNHRESYDHATNGNPRDSSRKSRHSSMQSQGRFDIENYRSPPPSSPPNLRIDTRSSKHRPVPPSNTPATLPQNAPTRSSPYETTSPTTTSPYGYGSARGLNSLSLSHTIDLHKRSRSPRGGRRNSDEDVDITTNPAYRLGRFESPKERNEGEQERPWSIGLPDGEKINNENKARPPRTSSLAASGSRSMNARPQRTQRQEQPAELQGSRVNGDESDEDIVMSSTAYPGQEWIPHSMGYD